MEFSEILKAQKFFKSGINVTKNLLKNSTALDQDEIELIYELQAGSYTDFYEKNRLANKKFSQEISSHISPFISNNFSLLDCGIGEATNLLPILEKMGLKNITGIDASFSRLSWAKENGKKFGVDLKLAVAGMMSLPFSDLSFDVAMTIHALETNGSNSLKILSELARVSKNLLILVEPDYSRAGTEQRNRMKSLRYAIGISEEVRQIGFDLIYYSPIQNNYNQANSASIWILRRQTSAQTVDSNNGWRDPSDKTELMEYHSGLRSPVGLWYPVLNEIPFLRVDDFKIVLNPYES